MDGYRIRFVSARGSQTSVCDGSRLVVRIGLFVVIDIGRASHEWVYGGRLERSFGCVGFEQYDGLTSDGLSPTDMPDAFAGFGFDVHVGIGQSEELGDSGAGL